MVAAREPVRIAGRYEIIDCIASGGMATVYRGWDYHTDRFVAIKALRLADVAAGDPFAVERFRREAQAAARVTHPNIVAIYDFVEDLGGLFLIMEYVDGLTLKQFIAGRGSLSPPRALAIAEQVCAGLAAAHAHGVVHRDVKPQNILLTADGRARLTDFGIVQLADREALTHSGIVLGTADYLAPEQACGETVTPVADLYALGIVLFEMLTGVLPFTGANPVAVAMRHANEQVPSLRAVAPDLSPAIEQVVRGAVMKDPRKRYQSAAQMGRELRRCRLLLSHPTVVSLPMRLPRKRKFPLFAWLGHGRRTRRATTG
jgi:serine/threonine protein kinase